MRITLVACNSHGFEAYESRLAKDLSIYEVPFFSNLSTEPSKSRPLVAVCRAVLQAMLPYVPMKMYKSSERVRSMVLE